MKLLVITQAVDTENPVLGFFHRWIEEFAKRVDSVEVICLEKGEYTLPSNVRVHSLGKEVGAVSRREYAQRFLKLASGLKNDYDVVFVHMNEEYVLLAGFLWRMWRKSVYLWRNHKVGSWRTNLAVWFATEVFCTTPFSYVAKFKKTKLMPVGIDTEQFAPGGQARNDSTILSLGRIAPVKRLEVLINACKILTEKGVTYMADIYGDALPADADYATGLQEIVQEKNLSSIAFKPAVRNTDTPLLYRTYDIFVNLTNTGSLDKTLFEAMACESLVVTSNEALKEIVPQELFFKEYDAASLAETFERTFALSSEKKEEIRKNYRAYVETYHSLRETIERIVVEFKQMV